MATSRRSALLARLSNTPGSTTAHKLCSISLESGLDGAAILLQSNDVITGASASAGSLGEIITHLELGLGEGPGHQAIAERSSIFADQLLTGPSETWPMFAQEARRAGIAAIFTFSLNLGSICVGALEVCRERPGPLNPGELIDLASLASLTTSALLLMQSGLQDGELLDLLEVGNPSQLRVHQATGMVAEQMQTSLSNALALLRAYALAHNLTLTEAADGIIARKIRMEN